MTSSSRPLNRSLIPISHTSSLTIGATTAVLFVLLGVVTVHPHPNWGFEQVIWLPSGLSVAVLLIFGLRLWPWIALGSFVVTMIDSGIFVHGLATAAANAGEAIFALFVLRREGFSSRFERGRDVVAFIALGAAIPTAIFALVSVTSLGWVGEMSWTQFPQMWFYWTITHALGVLILAPVLLTLATRGYRSTEGTWWEGISLLVALTGVSVLVFGPFFDVPESPFRIAFAPLPVLMWAAFRFGPLGAAFGSFLVSLIAMVGTVHGYGPFTTISPDWSLFPTWFFVNVSTVTTLLMAAFVAQRRQTEKALAESDGRLRTILDATGDGILVLDREGTVRHVNGRFIELWGFDPTVVQQGHPCDVFGEIASRLEEPDGAATSMRIQLESSERFAERMVLANGRILEHNSVPVPETAGLPGRIWFYRDITAAETAAQERRRLEQRMQHSQKLESLGILAGGIAHDFNNILMAIMGSADLAVDSLPDGSEARVYIEKVVTASQRAAGLSQQMLAYSGRGTFAIEMIDLEQTVRELSGLLESSISKRAKLRFDFLEELPPIRGDAAQIHQIIMNLVTNASDALEGADGTIDVRLGVHDCSREYLASCYVDDDLPAGQYLFVEVEDSGIGMDAATRAKIFDPFFTSKQTGRGLGLASTLGIVRGHHAAIRVDSEVGRGSRFRVLFPLSTAPKSTEVQSRSHGARSATGTVLVVDDEDIIRDVAAKILTGAGLHVIEASDGQVAVDVFRDKNGGIDVVLLDMTMPNLDGVQTLQEIRRMNANTPVILTSGFTEAEMADKVNGNALVSYLQKPYRGAALVSKMHDVLSGAR